MIWMHDVFVCWCEALKCFKNLEKFEKSSISKIWKRVWKVFFKKNYQNLPSAPSLFSSPAGLLSSWPIFSFSFSQPEADQATGLLSLARAAQLARAAHRAELPAQLSLFPFFFFFHSLTAGPRSSVSPSTSSCLPCISTVEHRRPLPRLSRAPMPSSRQSRGISAPPSLTAINPFSFFS
jgi:hypothetical protein